MRYLLDTNVLSETRRPTPNPGVKQYLGQVAADTLHISVITVGEVGRGITRLAARGDEVQADKLQTWLEELLHEFAERVLPVDVAVARRWAVQSATQPLATADGLIAATASAGNLTLVTRNVKDFERTGVRLLNPFTD